jgi:hypothetical protein
MNFDLSFKPKSKTAQYVDEYNMVLGQNRPWNPDGDHGMGDCIGTTADAYRAYHYEPFIEGIISCFPYIDDKYKVQGYRHPSLIGISPNDMSRDHVSYALYVLAYSGRMDDVAILSSYLRWKISDKYSFTIDLWLYMQALDDDNISRFFYYLITIPYMGFCIGLRNLVFRLFNVRKELSQETWQRKYDSGLQYPARPKWQTKIINFVASMLPVYTRYQTALMIDVLPNTFGKFILRKVLLAGTDKQNLVLRLILGDTDMSSDEVEAYQPMMGGRWTAELNELNDRDIYIITDPEVLAGNCIDRDLLRALYMERAFPDVLHPYM